jgi:wyosine [tRNA(Phe)-imidazoG37] synthetase (radical SAM superfamily)
MQDSSGVYLHPPGKLSRWGVVDVGLKCPHSCQFCYYVHLDGSADPFSGMRHAKFHSTEHLLDLARALKANGFVGADVTGGEPTLSPGIVELAREASRIGLALRIITLGQFLTRKVPHSGDQPLLAALLDAGITDFLFSVHAVEEASYHRITGGSWAKLRAAMEQLDGAGFDYCTNTTVHEHNFRALPEIAAEITGHRVYAANLIVMNAYYAWATSGEAKDVQAHYEAVRPYVLEARDRLEDAGIAVNVRYAPLCTMRGAERNLVGITSVRHDPHEWMNAIDHLEPRSPSIMGQRLALRDLDAGAPFLPAPPGEQVLAAGRPVPLLARRHGKVFPERCRGCAAAYVCDGIDPRYLAERGDAELRPYSAFRGDLLDRERLTYLPAFICKTAPLAEVRSAVRAAFGNRFKPNDREPVALVPI